MPEKRERKTPEQEVAEYPIGKYVIWMLLMFVLSAALFFGYLFLQKRPETEILTGMIQLLLFLLVVFFVMILSLDHNGYLYDNAAHPGRFFVVYCIGLVLVLLQCFLPPLLWLFLPLAVLLVLYAGTAPGTAAFFLLLFMQYTMTQSSPAVFVAFACAGLIGILLFCGIDSSFLFGVPLFTALVFLYVTLLTMEYAVKGALTFDSFLYAAINLFVSFLILTALLKHLSYHVLHKNRDKYQEINDPEYVLLEQLKNYSSRAYYHAVHTAYFCEKTARMIGADEMLAKAGGYYHKIGKMRGQNNLKNALEIAQEYHFPPRLIHLLREYGGKNTVLRSREAAIVLLSDAMVSSVMFLFEKNRNAVLDYGQIVDVVFQKQMESGLLDHCELSLEELTQIRRMFSEETLYYDFLR